MALLRHGEVRERGPLSGLEADMGMQTKSFIDARPSDVVQTFEIPEIRSFRRLTAVALGKLLRSR